MTAIAGLSRRALTVEIVVASTAVLAVLGTVKHLAAFIPFFAEHQFTIAVVFQLYVPILLVGRRGITKQSLGLPPLRSRAVLREVAVVSLLCAATIVPFALAHHGWQVGLFGRSFAWRFPPDLVSSLIVQPLVVALPEELYFRGYLQERFERLWPARRRLFGAPFGISIVLSAAVFALAHFVGEYQPARLGPFFPALVFGLLRARSGTIVGAVSYHAFCNVLGDVLFAFYSS